MDNINEILRMNVLVSAIFWTIGFIFQRVLNSNDWNAPSIRLKTKIAYLYGVSPVFDKVYFAGLVFQIPGMLNFVIGCLLTFIRPDLSRGYQMVGVALSSFFVSVVVGYFLVKARRQRFH